MSDYRDCADTAECHDLQRAIGVLQAANNAHAATIARLEADLAGADAEREAWKQSSALKLDLIKKLETENARLRNLLSSRPDA